MSKANRTHEDATRNKDVRPAEVRYINNVSVEEWDCPRPGAKHYLPKSVKANIKKNRKKFEVEKEMRLDSLSNK
jgi:hypothetical protein